MDIQFYEKRLEHVNEAAARNRWVLAASLVASGALIGATWNALPFGLYRFAQSMWSNGLATDFPTKLMQEALLRAWVETMFISIPALGIRFSIAHASVLGGGALLILAIWQFYAARRENHLIGDLLNDAQVEVARIRSFVYYGITGTQMFTTLTTNDRPIFALSRPGSRPVDGAKELFAVRKLSTLLGLIPALTLGFIVATDIASIFWIDAIFREGHAPLLKIHAGKELELAAAVAPIVGTAVIFLVAVAILLWRAHRFDQGTITLLRSVRELNWGLIEPGPNPVPTESSFE